MVNTTEFAEGQYLNAELIKSSPSKKGVVLDEAQPKKGNYGEQLETTVEIDGKHKKWSLSRDHVKSMNSVLGADSKLWIGAVITFAVTTSKNKEILVVIPQPKTT